MIYVKVFLNGLEVKGHAFFAESGKDIVCSAVSAVVQGFIKSFDNNEIDKYLIDNKMPFINFKTKNIINKAALNVLITQLKCIYHSSENYLKLEIVNEMKEN